jgi:hypothetical protein
MSIGGSLLNGSSMAASWGNMMSAVNIINMTSAVGSGIAGYMQASTMEYAEKYAKLMEEYQEKSKLYEEMYLKEFGNGNFAFDPNMLTNYLQEPPESFLQRTLMTGTDIAEMSLDMLSNFPKYTLSLDTMYR